MLFLLESISSSLKHGKYKGNIMSMDAVEVKGVNATKVVSFRTVEEEKNYWVDAEAYKSLCLCKAEIDRADHQSLFQEFHLHS